MQDQFFRKHEAVFRRQFYKFRKNFFTARYDAEFFLSALCLQYTDGIDLTVFQKWERLAFSHDCR